MTTQPDGLARRRHSMAHEALTEAAFRTGDFNEPQRLFAEAQSQAATEGDRRR